MRVKRHWSLWWLGEIEVSFRSYTNHHFKNGHHSFKFRGWANKLSYGRYIGTEIEVGRFRLFLTRSPYDDHQGEF